VEFKDALPLLLPAIDVADDNESRKHSMAYNG
jgi:hypothetical protein